MTGAGDDHLLDVTFKVETDAGGGGPTEEARTPPLPPAALEQTAPERNPQFTLDTTRYAYLHHASAVGEFFLASDSIVHSYRSAYLTRLGALMEQVPPEHAAQVHDEGSTIGGYLLSPGDVRDRKPTINALEECTPRSATTST